MWFPESLLKSVIYVNRRVIKNGDIHFEPGGTAFAVNYDNKSILVTCKHVAKEPDIWGLNNTLELFRKVGKPLVYPCVFHPTEDIAVMPFPLLKIEKGKELSDLDDVKLIGKDLFHDNFKDLKLGDDVFFVGFPHGENPGDRIVPFVRHGIISRKEDRGFFIDGGVFKGNSGSPVFLRPNFFQEDGLKIVQGKLQSRPAKLIGMITSGLSNEMLDMGYAVPTEKIIDVIKSKAFEKASKDVEKMPQPTLLVKK